jgi:hypothetical protein
MEGDARRISYQALGRGVPVRASGGEELGTVEHVLQVPAGCLRRHRPEDRRWSSPRDANQVADITDRYVLLNLPAKEAERLGRPQAPAVYHADPSEHAGGSPHDWFARRFGRGHWKPDA